ncbi:hypothetical protein MRX96_035745 [Rhipicephalus microplus]
MLLPSCGIKPASVPENCAAVFCTNTKLKLYHDSASAANKRASQSVKKSNYYPHIAKNVLSCSSPRGQMKALARDLLGGLPSKHRCVAVDSVEFQSHKVETDPQSGRRSVYNFLRDDSQTTPS